MKRIVLAFLVAPLVPVLLLALVDLIGSSGAASHSGNGALFALVVFVFVYPATAILGIPVYLYFRRKGWHQWWRVLLGGACIGLAPGVFSGFLALFADVRIGETLAMLLPFAGLAAAFGAVGALAFRVIAFPAKIDAEGL
jgi:hypothetical protein